MQPDTLIRNPQGRPLVRSVVVDTDAAAAWKVAGNFAGFDAFIPALSHIEMTGTGVGALRTKHFHDGHCVVEQLNSRDEQAMCMTWTLIYTTLDIARLWAAMQVETLGTQRSRVIWTINADSLGQDTTAFEAFLEGFADDALENLRRLLVPTVRS